MAGNRINTGRLATLTSLLCKLLSQPEFGAVFAHGSRGCLAGRVPVDVVAGYTWLAALHPEHKSARIRSRGVRANSLARTILAVQKRNFYSARTPCGVCHRNR
jgi:hypothetical protein